MVKLKNNITGFIYESVHGYIKTIFTEPISSYLMIGKDDMLVNDENVNELFSFSSKEDLEDDVEGLIEVLEWVD
jgi:hypothetical protein